MKIKTKTKEIINKKMKQQPSEWEIISANEATDEGLFSKIYRLCISIKIKKKSKNGQKT